MTCNSNLIHWVWKNESVTCHSRAKSFVVPSERTIDVLSPNIFVSSGIFQQPTLRTHQNTSNMLGKPLEKTLLWQKGKLPAVTESDFFGISPLQGTTTSTTFPATFIIISWRNTSIFNPEVLNKPICGCDIQITIRKPDYAQTESAHQQSLD